VPRPLIIDTDCGVDDAAALWWALTDPRLELIGVTTVAGVVDAATAARNVLRVLEAAGRTEIPVAIGADTRYGPAPALRPATFIHGDDGLGNVAFAAPPRGAPQAVDAVDLLHELCADRSDVALVTLGPLTNIANAIGRAPAWATRLQELVVMGGAARVGGNALPAGEANIAHDPHAAHAVVNAAWPAPPLLVGLDVTHQATLSDAEFALLAARRTPAARFLDAPLRFYRTYGSTFTAPDCPCHDLLAVLALAEPDVIRAAPVLPLGISTGSGPACGATIVDFRAQAFARLGGSQQHRPQGFGAWRIALDADVSLFRRLVRGMFGEN
jgi:purine nucleosidase